MSLWGSGTRAHRLAIASAGSAGRYLVETTSVIFRENAPADSPLRDPRLVFLGPDSDGELLEVMAIPTDDDGLPIIHAQHIRARYLTLLKEGLR